MASQTGSIDLTASNGVKLMAEAGFENIEENYATKGELDVQADRIGMVVANNDASSSLQLTADAMTYIGNNVTIKGTDGTTTAISGGRIQANSLSIGALDSAAQSATLNSNISVGGRNLLAKTKELTSGVWVYDGATRGDNVALIATSDKRIYQLPSVGYWTWTTNTTYVVSVDARADASTVLEINAVGAGEMKKQFTVGTSWKRYVFVLTPTTVNTGSLSFYRKGSANTTLYLRRPKLEVGNKATDWTPAPEDVDSAISNAAKTATSYVTNITGGGIMVHPSDDATSGVKITSDVDIMRDGTSVINIGTNDAVRVGVDDNAHVKMLLESDAMEIDNEVGDQIFVVEANRSGTTTETVTANDVAVWSGINDVTTATYTITDAGTTSGTATAIVTVDNVQYELDSSQATTTVTVGSNVTATLTSSGVTYVRGLMTVVEEDEEGVETTTYLQCSLSVRYVHIVADSAIMTLDGRQVINGERKLLTLSNDQWSSSNETDNFVLVETKGPSNKTYAVAFGVGSSGSTRGVYDSTNGDWIIYRNSIGQTGISSSKRPIVINGTNFSVDASGNVRSVGTGYLTNLSMTGWVRKLTSDWSSSNQKATFIWAENSVTGQKLAFGITNNGYHRGLYDGSESRWIVVKYQSGQVLYYGLHSNFDAVSVTILSGSTTIAAGGLHTGTTDISKSGWYPIAIAGWTANTRYAVPVRYYLSARGNGTGTISWGIYNPSGNNQAPTVNAVVLWARGD